MLFVPSLKPTRKPTIYTNKRNQYGVLAWLAITSAALVGLIFDDSEGGWSPEETLAVVLPVLAVYLVGGYWRLYRAGVYAHDWWIAVVNPLSTRRARWEEIEGFSVGTYPGMYKVGFVRLRDGRTWRLVGTAGWAPFLGKRLADEPDRIVEQLNAVLSQRRQGGPEIRSASDRNEGQAT